MKYQYSEALAINELLNHAPLNDLLIYRLRSPSGPVKRRRPLLPTIALRSRRKFSIMTHPPPTELSAQLL